MAVARAYDVAKVGSTECAAGQQVTIVGLRNRPSRITSVARGGPMVRMDTVVPGF